MAERLEYAGEPLPSGLPGFGGETIQVLTLPGFNRVVAAQKFGPVNDAPTITPPNPIPPPGSNPEDPTPIVVPPAPPPPPQGGGSNNFCERCVPPDFNITNFPLMMAVQAPSSCVDCQGDSPGFVAQPEIAAYSNSQGIFWNGDDGIDGKTSGGSKQWSVNSTELKLDGSIGGVTLNETHLILGLGGGQQTFYQAGPEIIGPDGKHYTPKDLEVCVGGQSQTWKVLACVA